LSLWVFFKLRLCCRIWAGCMALSFSPSSSDQRTLTFFVKEKINELTEEQ
jgi:hypothetical protein